MSNEVMGGRRGLHNIVRRKMVRERLVIEATRALEEENDEEEVLHFHARNAAPKETSADVRECMEAIRKKRVEEEKDTQVRLARRAMEQQLQQQRSTAAQQVGGRARNQVSQHQPMHRMDTDEGVHHDDSDVECGSSR